LTVGGNLYFNGSKVHSPPPLTRACASGSYILQCSLKVFALVLVFALRNVLTSVDLPTPDGPTIPMLTSF